MHARSRPPSGNLAQVDHRPVGRDCRGLSSLRRGVVVIQTKLIRARPGSASPAGDWIDEDMTVGEHEVGDPSRQVPADCGGDAPDAVATVIQFQAPAREAGAFPEHRHRRCQLAASNLSRRHSNAISTSRGSSSIQVMRNGGEHRGDVEAGAGLVAIGGADKRDAVHGRDSRGSDNASIIGLDRVLALDAGTLHGNATPLPGGSDSGAALFEFQQRSLGIDDVVNRDQHAASVRPVEIATNCYCRLDHACADVARMALLEQSGQPVEDRAVR